MGSGVLPALGCKFFTQALNIEQRRQDFGLPLIQKSYLDLRRLYALTYVTSTSVPLYVYLTTRSLTPTRRGQFISNFIFNT